MGIDLTGTFRRLTRRLARIPAPIQGVLYMTGACFLFSVMNLIVRVATAELSPLQVTFFRNLFALLFMLPWALMLGGASLKTSRFKAHGARALVSLVSMYCWFTALAYLPLADAVALNFTAPLFITIGAALVLGEVVRARRWTATVIGFAGTLVILRPGFVEITPVMMLPIGAAMLMAVTTLIVKSLSRDDPPGTIVLYMNLLLTPLSLVPAIIVWEWPSAATWWLLVGLGLLAAVGHILLTRAFVKADASAVQPIDFTRLPFAAALGYLCFGEVPGAWIWLGGAMIAGSAVYITHREATVARERRMRKGEEESCE